LGRYYNGDIEGKFWFAVQSSDDAEQFGAYECTSYIQYCVNDIDTVKDRLVVIINELGLKQDFIETDTNTDEGEDIFFDKYKEAGEKTSEQEKLWASLELGLKIYHCLKEQGHCSFEAEL